MKIIGKNCTTRIDNKNFFNFPSIIFILSENLAFRSKNRWCWVDDLFISPSELRSLSEAASKYGLHDVATVKNHYQ